MAVFVEDMEDSLKPWRTPWASTVDAMIFLHNNSAIDFSQHLILVSVVQLYNDSTNLKLQVKGGQQLPNKNMLVIIRFWCEVE